ncbi:MAG TPA: NADH-quinone oxidoreductase subunit J [Alphaproteobacteria bacterium]|nr:NADH-quinone oxidoreductase subunit J [Alphaproteobacteria bacterium]HAJ46566.1 NADH-quinone oxidoreductase subunit J [Alphaproteobacteria bacterium]
MLMALAFYLFAAVLTVAAVMVIAARNPVHSVLFLILAFFNAAGLFVLLGAEFLAMTLVIVYVGAVAVLFLFVVMMLDIDFTELREGFLNYAPIGGLIGGVLLIELVLFLGGMMVAPASSAPRASPVREGVSNTQALGEVIYTQYIFVFQAAGMILLIAMIGAIVLTLRERTGVRRQNVAAQVGRTRAQAVENVDIKPGAGI